MRERTVTIFVTVYNIEKHLDRFFDCLKAQTYTDYEVLMIDDGSTDAGLAVCQKHAESDDRIRVISVGHIGISAARNLAFENLRTPYAASLDGDDYFEKDYLKHLMDAEEKTGADMVLSNVILVHEDGTEKNRFTPRAEGFYTQEAFPELLPELLSEERLNFLYAKLYKTELLHNVRIEPDVMQGSDTMVNFKYLKNVHSIAVIEDYDYYYVQYRKRSVTSYIGKDYFERRYRINKFLLDITEEYDWQNDKMLCVIDCRIVHTAANALRRIAQSSDPPQEQYRRAAEIIGSEAYLTSYRRLINSENADSFYERYHYAPVAPGEEKAFIDRSRKVFAEEKQNEKLGRLREKCPDAVFRIWHKLRVLTGTARKE